MATYVVQFNAAFDEDVPVDSAKWGQQDELFALMSAILFTMIFMLAMI